MSTSTITAVITRCVQIGHDEFTMKNISCNFSTSRSVDDILKWVKSEGIENPTINDVLLCDYTGESI